MAAFFGLALDATTHDLFLAPDGNLATVTDNEAIAQHAKQRLLSYRGEWFLDTEAGVPWFQEIFVRPHNPAIIDALIKREILDTPGVASLDSFDLEIDERRRSISVLEAVGRSILDESLEVTL
ncbi:hypothetical protein PMNALOAF_1265 [Methylobacterium adhaesivum]|uniref:Uncharacterized protein n=1 Tax=Methylobacterium adhaesivum TaxID=333297 RepID=A0ABT8BEN7_9HYPH|nr:hypothetical protein [Methylobacterium adhaesivum]MDN3590592.1 hypothetical protein [Methylobacterium adhaesivum]GJD30022.1 hypothetical protein PMNALOAF_1265 [Methylobacterium adhaesivum]